MAPITAITPKTGRANRTVEYKTGEAADKHQRGEQYRNTQHHTTPYSMRPAGAQTPTRRLVRIRSARLLDQRLIGSTYRG